MDEETEAWGKVSSSRLGRELVAEPRLNNNDSKDSVVIYQAMFHALYIMPFNIHNNPVRQVLSSSPFHGWEN